MKIHENYEHRQIHQLSRQLADDISGFGDSKIAERIAIEIAFQAIEYVRQHEEAARDSLVASRLRSGSRLSNQ